MANLLLQTLKFDFHDTGNFMLKTSAAIHKVGQIKAFVFIFFLQPTTHVRDRPATLDRLNSVGEGYKT